MKRCGVSIAVEPTMMSRPVALATSCIVRSSEYAGYPGSNPGYAGTYEGDAISVEIGVALTGHVELTDARSETLRQQLADAMAVGLGTVTSWSVEQERTACYSGYRWSRSSAEL